MRDGRHIANGAHFNAGRCQSAHRRLATGTRAADTNVHAAHTVIARHVGGIRGCLLRGERRAFTRSAEAQRSRTFPRQNVSIHVSDGHDRVVEGRLHVAQTMRNVLALLLLERFLLAFFSGAAVPPAAAGFAMKSVLSSQFPVLRKPGLNRELRTENWVSMFSTSPSSWSIPFPYADLCGCARWYACAVPAPAGCGGDGSRDRSRFR